LAFVFGALTFVATMAGGLFVLKYRKFYGIILSFTGSALVALSLFDLLPDSVNLASKNLITITPIALTIASGFFLLLALERFFSVKMAHDAGENKYVRKASGGWFATGEIVVHSFIEGIAIGASFTVSFQIGFAVGLAIISHDVCDGINTVTIMLNTNNSKGKSVLMLILVSIAPLLGVSSTLFFNIPESYLVFMIAFLIGGFLYLGASECLPGSFEKNRPAVTIISSFAGFLLMFLVSKFS